MIVSLRHSVRHIVVSACFAVAAVAASQVPQFGLNAQHTSQYAVAAQRMNQIKWSAQINENVSGGFAHYGAPLVTAAGTVIIMIRTATDGFDLVAYDGTTGSQKYRIATDYIGPSAAWLIPAQPVLATNGTGTHLYYPAGGGTLMRLDNPDSNSPGTPTRIVFYGSEATYLGNKANFDSTVFVNTPITTDSSGNLFFGTRVNGTAPAPLSTTQSFLVRIDGSSEAATYTDCFTATGDATVSRISHACAPALSADEQTLYVGMKGTSSVTSPYLVSVDAASLAPIAKVLLKDPRNGNNANMNDISTATPMVAPDGDVYYGVLPNPQTTSRGWLLRFTADLSTEKTPGAFGWDYTPGVVPASMVPSYTGTSTYLLFCKFNNYVSGDGNGINTVAIIDPNATQLDFHSTAPGLVETRQVLTMISPSPDPAYSTMMGAAREWCINACAVDPANGSVYFNDEDGHMYRWNLSSNSLSESIQLNSGVGQPYVPTVIGPDGTLFTLNGGYLYAIGGLDDVSVTVASSQPDVLTVLSGDSITFTATVSGNSGVPTGTVTFEDTTIDSYAPNTVTLATVPLDGSGVATYTSSALDGGAVALGSNLGNHRIKAIYSGDGTYGPGEAKLHQKVHAFATSTAMVPSGDFTVSGNTTFTATVTPIGSATVPTGYVTFFDGALAIAQIPLDGSGVAAYTSTGLSAGSHTINAVYNADTWFAKSQDSDPVTIYQTPVATDDTYTTLVNTPVNEAAPGVLGNDTGPAVTAVLVSPPTHAAAFSLNSDGSFSYTATTGYLGSDTFTYKAQNPTGDSNTATVTIWSRLQRNAEFISQSVPSVVAPGATFSASITMKNTGIDTWSEASQFRLMSQNPMDNATWTYKRFFIFGATTVPSNATHTFTRNLVAPSTPGTYNFQWRMHKENPGGGNFGAFTTNLTIVVATPRNAQFVSQSVPSTVSPGQTFTASVTMKNTGSEVWSEANQFRMMSQNPFDNATWGYKRMFIAGATTVANGANYTFSRSFIAPTTPGTYNFQWRMHKEGSGNFGATSTNVAIVVQNVARDAQFVSQSVPTVVTPGATFSASVTMRNTGTQTWSEAQLFRMMSQNPVDNAIWTYKRMFIGGATTVATGATYTFTRNFIAPSTPGTYNFQWRMHKESTGNFGETTPNVVITVVARDAQFISQSVPSSVAAGATFSASVTMKNTGSETWSEASGFRMMSQNPFDNATWGFKRMFIFGATTVAPNANYTFTRNFTAPSTPGTYNFQWRMHKEGEGNFGQLTVNVVITVT